MDLGSPPAVVAHVNFPVVGIGASAGGLEALEAFFHNMPGETGLAFVVVQHLSPDFKSVMDELLARHTRITIHRVTDGMTVEPNAIYLIPPKKEMIISDGKLLLSDKDPEQGFTLPIDIFFRSLAQDVGANAIGIVLSGTGSDGSRGICDIHNAGGFVVAQEVDSAKFDGMPKSAIETGIVDLVLRPEQIPTALLSYIRHPCAGDQTVPMPIDPALLEGFDAVFQLLRRHYDIDFSHYKRSTVTRRVQRRLLMNQVTDLDDYVGRLRTDPNELNLLYKDLLIGVTRFFRDTAAFTRLDEEVIPALLNRVRPEDELRIWCAGCATGEEPYSVAILVHEQLEALKRKINVKLFATDVHRASLETASNGTYSEEALAAVSPERLERYFKRVRGGYQVRQDLRQMIVFAPHNLIKDAPFTKIDLITCRNMLIYLESPAQKKALSLFHFALNMGGVMMLGPSESPGDLAEEFDAIDDRWKIYRKRRDKRLSPELRLPLSPGYTSSRMNPTINSLPRVKAALDEPLIQAYEELVRSHAPPTLLVDSRRELVQSLSGASAYLRIRDGRPSADILDLVLPELKIPLSAALQNAMKKRAAVVFTGLNLRTAEGDVQIKLTVRPLNERQTEAGHYLISLEPSVPTTRRPDESEETIDLQKASKDQVSDLEDELRHTKESLQATVEEMETSNEELQAANEELVAANEELQSTNEELHSVNEELYTVNAEYQKKIAELTELTADMDNLLQSTEVGVVFLDRDLCIRRFTPKIAETFHLLPLDVGRRIDSFSHTIDRPELLDDIRRVLTEEVPFESEVVGEGRRSFLLRILPYRVKGKVQGVVLTLIDVTALKRAKRELLLMSKVFHDGVDPMVIEDLSGRILDLNAEAEAVYGYSREELIGQDVGMLVPPDERLRARELRQRCREKAGLRNIETVKCNQNGETIPVLLTLSLLTDHNGKPAAIGSIAKDITDRKRAEFIDREAVRKRDQFLAMLSHELRNPLGAVLNATYLLNREIEDGVAPTLGPPCRIIQRQVLQVARLLDDLLDVSRVTQGKIEIRRLTIDATKLVDDAVTAVRPLIDSRGHQLTVEVTSAPLFIEGDPARLLQIQENLLTNAAKYTPPHGRLKLSVQQEDHDVVIRVSDNGKGIPSHMLESIFELFTQSDHTLDRSDGGMGLGLTLVRMLVRLHGGTVTAHSDGPGKGSEFVVRLPLTPAPRGEIPAGPHDSSPKNDKRQIVIVEDNDDSRFMLEALLKLDGFQVTTAKDGRQGLETILHVQPDLAIVDIGLPGMNGYEIARSVRRDALNANIFLVAVTGYGSEEDRETALRAGFNAHLTKPLKPAELARMLHSAQKT